ncbi:uncharacterized protein LOC109518422 [Hippocampus comes]|uniref:uncharacterized protein LOC109518422 n=1 Tax=Hippocampus comes TaxID=109280 RepID=UPI00094EA73D|nr:PREDICTED: uncharacterized protein LOC109518422 [Hippocampus comes]
MTSVVLVFLALLAWKVSTGCCSQLCHVNCEGSNMSPQVLQKTKLTCDSSVPHRIFSGSDVTLNDTHFDGPPMHKDQVEAPARKQKGLRLLRFQRCQVKDRLLRMQIYGEHRHAHLIRSSFDVSHITALARSDFQYVYGNPDLIIKQRLLNGTHMSSVLYCSLGTEGFRCPWWRQRGGICCEQILTLTTHSLKGSFPTRADTIKFSPAREEGWLPAHTSRWVGRVFLAAVLLAWVRMTRMKMSAIRVGGTTVVTFFSFNLCWIPPPVTMCPWLITLAACLKYFLSTSSLLVISRKALLCAMKWFRSTWQQCRELPVTVLILCLTLCLHFPAKSDKHWYDDVFPGLTMPVLDHLEFASHLYRLFTPLSTLLLCIWTQPTPVIILLHAQLVACVHSSRVPTKYVLVIKINQMI